MGRAVPVAVRARRRYAEAMRPIVPLLCLILAAPAFALPAAGEAGMVATAHPAASEAGAAMLRRGGNAVDAAVAAAFALAVAEPYSSGIGGGGFALVRFGEALTFLDFRETAPRRATRDMFLEDGRPVPERARDGALAVGVPGAVKGYLALHARWGALPRAVVLEPAIRIAEHGFLVDARYRAFAQWRLDVLRRDPDAARIFLVPGEGGPQVPPLGHRVVQMDLARTLRAIAREGARAFYEGPIAARLAADMAARGGLVDEADLKAYEVVERRPLVGRYRGHAIATAPPPSAGGEVVLATLGVLETLPDDAPWRDPAALHLYVETLKRVYADRALFGDPAFVDVPMQALLAPDRLRALAALAGERSTPAQAIVAAQGTPLAGKAPAPGPAGDGTETSHLSVVDAAGNAVSLTTTLNYGFGAGIVARGTGVLWNDEMDDFSIAPGVPNVYGVVGAEANAIAPGKRPVSSMAPTIVFAGPNTDAPVRLVVGAAGGPRIPTAVLQAIHAHLAYGADVEQALALGRVHHQHLPDVTTFEPFALDAATQDALRARGHALEERAPWANATAIAVDPETGVRTGAADPRGVGAAVAQ